jgi:hypothetical protein
MRKQSIQVCLVAIALLLLSGFPAWAGDGGESGVIDGGAALPSEAPAEEGSSDPDESTAADPATVPDEQVPTAAEAVTDPDGPQPPEEPPVVPDGQTPAPEEPAADPDEQTPPEEPTVVPDEQTPPEEPAADPDGQTSAEEPIAVPDGQTPAGEEPATDPDEQTPPEEEPPALPGAQAPAAAEPPNVLEVLLPDEIPFELVLFNGQGIVTSPEFQISNCGPAPIRAAVLDARLILSEPESFFVHPDENLPAEGANIYMRLVCVSGAESAAVTLDTEGTGEVFAYRLGGGEAGSFRLEGVVNEYGDKAWGDTGISVSLRFELSAEAADGSEQNQAAKER